MKKNQLLVAAAVLVGLVLVWLATRQSPYERAENLPNLPTIKADDIVAVTLEHGETRIKLGRENDQWFIVEPARFRADAGLVRSTLEKIEELRITHSVSDRSDSFERFDLTPEKQLRVTVEHRCGSFAFVLGKNAPNFSSTFLRLPDRDTVYSAANAIRRYFERELSEWRDKTMLEFTDSDAAEVSYEWTQPATEEQRDEEGHVTTPAAPGASHACRFVRDEAGNWSMPTDPTFRVSKSKVDGLASALAAFRATGFADTAGADSGFDAPEIRVRVKMRDQSEHVLTVGGKNDEGDYFARVGDREQVFTLRSWQISRFQKPCDEYRDASSTTVPGDLPELAAPEPPAPVRPAVRAEDVNYLPPEIQAELLGAAPVAPAPAAPVPPPVPVPGFEPPAGGMLPPPVPPPPVSETARPAEVPAPLVPPPGGDPTVRPPEPPEVVLPPSEGHDAL